MNATTTHTPNSQTAAVPLLPEARQKAGEESAKQTKKTAAQQQALTNAMGGQSLANYETILKGFSAMGIPLDEILPRQNVFTFNAWKALGRTVKKGQHGIRIVTVIPCTKKDSESGAEIPVKKVKKTTVFHLSQTEAFDYTVDSEPLADVPAVAVSQQPAAIAQNEPRAYNAYEEKLAAKKARYEERAANAEYASQETYRQARRMGDAIPFGQPILVGHHSEGRDRNYRAKIHNTYGKAFELQDKAEYYAQKAARIGTGGISSDDPEAIQKLRDELTNLGECQYQYRPAMAPVLVHRGR